MDPTRSTPYEPSNVLAVIADAGVALLSSGAEVSRVEDTMERLAGAYQIGHLEAVVLPTALFVYAPDGQTILRRVRRRSVNLAVLAAVNQLSRDVARTPIPVDELKGRIGQAVARVRYPAWSHPLFAAAGAAFISQLMGGTRIDLAPAAVAGAITQLVRQRLRTSGVPGSVADLLSAVLAVMPALAAAWAGIPNPGAILVGAVMVLTPGLLMTTAVRDGIAGDLLSAAARLLEAFLSGAAIAAGASLSLYVYLALGGRWP
ncbi:MAG: threonine/serine exporter family protein [Thermaerobacter sp.]|nr:threonine/serine exporter family protein [Thermaerobacter sp.]